MSRVERLRARLEPLRARTFLVSNPVNVRYLTGFESSNPALLVSVDGVRLLADGRYVEAARAVEGVEVVQSARELPAFLAEELPRLAEPPVAFEAGFVTVAAHEAIAASGVALVPTTGIVEGLRAIKDEEEIAAIRAAAATTNRTYERLAREGLAGRSEADVAWWLAEVFQEEAGAEAAFPTIVASGPNAARPHHRPGGRTVGPGETILVDMGAGHDGYASDCTRTFASGALPPELAEAYDVCRAAQEAALEAVRPGASARDVDAVARARVAGAGYEVLHGLGHGVGLAIHELPRLADTSDETLEAGNVVTVEPGVYLEGRGGVRIEDLVVVREDGPEVLTTFTKELVTLG